MGPGGALGTHNKEQNGKKDQNGAFFGVLSFMKIPLVSPSLNEKEQKCFGHPKFYCSIAPMKLTNKEA